METNNIKHHLVFVDGEHVGCASSINEDHFKELVNKLKEIHGSEQIHLVDVKPETDAFDLLQLRFEIMLKVEEVNKSLELLFRKKSWREYIYW